jgi:hypothetical protein
LYAADEKSRKHIIFGLKNITSNIYKS